MSIKQDTSKQRELLTVGEFATTLRVSPMTIRRRIDDGTLKSVRLGHVTRVPASELSRLGVPPDPNDGGKA
jgi:excisionase family DNA binding protein